MYGYIFNFWSIVFGTTKRFIDFQCISMEAGGFEFSVSLFWLSFGVIKFSNYDKAKDKWSAQRERLFASAAWKKGWPR